MQFEELEVEILKFVEYRFAPNQGTPAHVLNTITSFRRLWETSVAPDTLCTRGFKKEKEPNVWNRLVKRDVEAIAAEVSIEIMRLPVSSE
jgi:hypothetical protein